MHHTIRYSTRALLCAAVLVLALPGCQKASEALAEKAVERALEQAAGGKDVDLQQDGDTTTLKIGDAEIKVAHAEDGGSLSLPADFPTDVYLPAQHAVVSAVDIAGHKMVNLTTRESYADVSAALDKAMQAQGWTRDMAMQTGAGNSTAVYSKEQRQAAYTLVDNKESDGTTQIAVRIGNNGSSG